MPALPGRTPRSSAHDKSFQMGEWLPIWRGTFGGISVEGCQPAQTHLATFEGCPEGPPCTDLSGSKVAKLTHKGVAIFRMSRPGARLQRLDRVEGCHPTQTHVAIFNRRARAPVATIHR